MPSRLICRLASLIFFLVSASAVTATEIYKHTDAEGNVTFSDQPPAPGETAERVQLRELNTTPATKSPAPAVNNAPTEQAQPREQRQLTVSIASPADETTIAMGPGDVTVTAQAEPALGPLEALQLFLDGEPFGDPQPDATWSLQGLLRGPHDLRIERLDRRGNRLAGSDSVRIYVLRPSVNQLQRP